MRVPLVVFVGV